MKLALVLMLSLPLATPKYGTVDVRDLRGVKLKKQHKKPYPYVLVPQRDYLYRLLFPQVNR